ncbi:MAG: SCP2 sterol-binding domain-containing protein [Pseudomonadota bacterium]
MDPTLHIAGAAALETALNRAFSLDPAVANRLGELEGEVFHLACTAPAIDLYLAPRAGRVRLKSFHDGNVTTSVRGTARDFADLATADDAAAALINGNIELSGDSAPLMTLQRILSSLELDWEAPLVNALGDVVGHQLAEALRGLFSWGRMAQSSLLRQLEEFVHEEARLSPPKAELEDFYEDVAILGQRVERLQAKLRRLAARVPERS